MPQRPALVLLLIAGFCLFVGGCGRNAELYQSRYIPRPSELSWEKDYKQLPWRPPSLKDDHYHRRGRSARPRYAADINVTIADGPDGYRYAGDGKEGDSGTR